MLAQIPAGAASFPKGQFRRSPNISAVARGRSARAVALARLAEDMARAGAALCAVDVGRPRTGGCDHHQPADQWVEEVMVREA